MFLNLNFINFVIIFLAVIIGIYLIYSYYFQRISNLKLSEVTKNYKENKKLTYAKYIFYIIGFIFLLLASLGPYIYQFWWNKDSSGYIIVFVVDTSKSMDVQDIVNWQEHLSRLDFTKKIIQDFITNNNWNEYSLIAFAGNALNISPLTTQTETFLTFLNNLNSSTVVQWGTNISEAIKLAVSQLWEKTVKNIVLISDGWDKEDMIDFDNIKNSIWNNPIKIFALWVWTSNWGYIPIGKDFFWNINYKKWQGENVISNLYEDNLKKITKLWNWKYINASELWSLEKLKSYFTKSDINWIHSKQDNWWRYFVIIAFLFFIIATLLPNKKLLWKI